MRPKIAAIANPYAANGRLGQLWPQLAGRLRGRFGDLALRLTDSPGHATRIARDLIDNGYTLIIAVGGDGTISEVANGFLLEDMPRNPDARLGILPVGTGGDLRRTLLIPTDPEGAIKIIAEGRPLTLDVGKVSLEANDGTLVDRYFVNLVSFGMGGEVAAGAKNRLTAFGGKTAFLWATLKAVAAYHGRRIEIELDEDGRQLSHFVTNVAVGNGRYHGGGMQPCPQAIMSDGVLDVTVIDYLHLIEVVRDIRVLYSDDVHRHPKVHHLRARKLTARADRPTLVEVDGEALGRLPIEIRVLPRRLPVMLDARSPLFETAESRS